MSTAPNQTTPDLPPISRKDQHIRAAFLEALLDLRKAHFAGEPTDKFGAVTNAIAAAYPDVIERYEQEAGNGN